MKIISLRILGALVGLCLLAVIVSDALADDATDWANQQAQAQRDREQAERDQQEREKWQNQQAQAQKDREDWERWQAQIQKEREDWANWQAQAQRDREQAARDQEEREKWEKEQAQAQKERDFNEWWNKMWQDSENQRKWDEERAKARQEEINQGEWGTPAAPQPGAVLLNQTVAGQGAGPALPAPPPPQPGAKRPERHTITIENGGQVTRTTFVMEGDGSWHASEGVNAVTPAAPKGASGAAPPPFDPAAFQQAVRQNQERVRQQILQKQQQMRQRIGR